MSIDLLPPVFALVWSIYLTAYQTFMSYLMQKFYLFLNV